VLKEFPGNPVLPKRFFVPSEKVIVLNIMMQWTRFAITFILFISVCEHTEQNPISFPESLGFLVSGSRRERLWVTGNFTTEILWLSVLSFVTVNSQLKKKSHFFHSSRVCPSDRPLIKKPEVSGNKIEQNLLLKSQSRLLHFQLSYWLICAHCQWTTMLFAL